MPAFSHRDHHGHVVVEDLDREVLALLAEHLLLLLLEDLARAVVRVDDVVADLELDVLDLAVDLEVLECCSSFVVGMVSSFGVVAARGRPVRQVCR